LDKKFHQLLQDRGDELSVRYDSETESIWAYANPSKRPSYTIEFVKEFHQLQLDIIEYFQYYNMKTKTPIKYFVNASMIPGVYNYGGDLYLFSELIKKKDKKKLFEYAKSCVDIVYLNAVNLNLPLTTITLIEGDALGGGFEAAISCNIVIAEEQSQMGLPEIRFNLIPGMGAYSFLARLVGIKMAEEIISSGKMYDATALYEMGVITEVVKRGEGIDAVNKFMTKNNKLFNGMQALQAARRRYQALDYDELIDITKIWVDAALRLTPKDLKMMQKLVDAQNKKNIDMQYKLRTKQDRRFEREIMKFPFKDSKGNIIEKERRINKDPR